MAALPILVRIPFSHFCKKAEWGLTQANIAYRTWDILPAGTIRLAKITPEGTVPILLDPQPNHSHPGRPRDILLDGSDAILPWADEHGAGQALYPRGLVGRVKEWEQWAGDEIGPAVRREAYRVAFNDPGALDLGWQSRLVARLGRQQILQILKFYKARRFDDADAAFFPVAIDRIASALVNNGSGYLVGDQPTAADVSVAALMQPLLYVAKARGHDAQPGWNAVASHIERIKPRKTTRRSRRWMRGRDWTRLEAATR